MILLPLVFLGDPWPPSPILDKLMAMGCRAAIADDLSVGWSHFCSLSSLEKIFITQHNTL